MVLDGSLQVYACSGISVVCHVALWEILYGWRGVGQCVAAARLMSAMLPGGGTRTNSLERPERPTTKCQDTLANTNQLVTNPADLVDFAHIAWYDVSRCK